MTDAHGRTPDVALIPHRKAPMKHSTLRTALCAVSAAAALVAGTTPAHAADSAHLKRGQAYAGWSVDAGLAGKSSASSRSTAAAAKAATSTQTLGIDVSAYQGTVNWSSQYSSGVRWAYTKATEGNYNTNSYFSSQYTGAYKQGIIRGAYHFAIPNGASAKTQADYFVNHGGGWSKDGMTLPGMVDLEYNPYGATCYGLSKSAMVSWIKAFITEYKARTTRYPVIYTTYSWWSQCTGNTSAFSANSPLWIARYASTAGTLPAGWSYYTMWQYSATTIDKDWFNGSVSRVKALANG